MIASTSLCAALRGGVEDFYGTMVGAWCGCGSVLAIVDSMRWGSIPGSQPLVDADEDARSR
jgi:hypothetical protein